MAELIGSSQTGGPVIERIPDRMVQNVSRPFGYTTLSMKFFLRRYKKCVKP